MCAKKLDNPEERNKFLETYNLARLNQEETDNLNRLISSGEIEKVKTKRKTNNNKKKQFPANTSPNSHNFTGKFKQPYKDLEKKKKKKNLRGNNTSKFILWSQHYPDTKPNKNTQNENDRPISLRNTDF